MKPYIVTEGQSDAELLKRILGSTLEELPFIVVAGGKTAVVSMAQSLLVSRRAPIAVLIDADTFDSDAALEQQRIYSDLLKPYAHRVPFTILVAVPELETVLFEVPGVVEEELGIPVSDQDRTEAKVRPKQVLTRLVRRSARKTMDGFFTHLSDDAAKRLAKAKPIEGLVQFLRSPKSHEERFRRRRDNVA